jgi:hypothetical protein
LIKEGDRKKVDADRFFGLPVDLISLPGKGLALLLAVLIGGLIGYERQWCHFSG